MKRLLMASTFIALASPALAQTANSTAVNTTTAVSRSQAAATAIGGGAGGNATGGNVTINQAALPTATTTTQAINTSGTQTIRTNAANFAPGLTAAGIESCLGSVSGGASWVGTGFSLGGTVQDRGCNLRLWARTLWSIKLQAAAVAVMCLDPDVYRSMPDVCLKYMPQPPVQSVTYVGPGPIFGTAVMTNDTSLKAETPEYSGGPVEIVIARTGEHKMCNDYDVKKRRCRAFAH